jgi:hypothetical protein
MNTLPTYVPSTYGATAVAGVYYVFLAIATFLSIATIFVLINRSKAKPLAFIVSVVYMMIYFALVSQGLQALSLIK